MKNPYENVIPNNPTENSEKKLSPEEKQEKIGKKIEAIKKQSPDLSQDELETIAATEVDKFVEVWGAINTLGEKWYRVDGESKKKMAEWKEKVAQIKDVLDGGDFEKIPETEYWDGDNEVKRSIFENINSDAEKFGGLFGDREKTLLAISLWLKREQGGKWAGDRKTIWRVLSAKDPTSLFSILDKNGAPACVDTSFLTKALAEEFSIQGEVKKVPMSKGRLAPEKMSHFYFQAKTETESEKKSDESSGAIVDYWWARGKESTGGLKLTQNSYDKTVVERTDKKICGY